MSGRWILYLGYNDLYWGHLGASAFLGETWDTGKTSSVISLGTAGATLGAPDSELTPDRMLFNVATEIDDRLVYLPPATSFSGEVRVEMSAQMEQGDLALPVAPPMGDFLRQQVSWYSQQLRLEPGLVLVPRDWNRVKLGRRVMKTWADAGWTLGNLEDAILRQLGTRARAVIVTGMFARILDRNQMVVVPSSWEAALALCLGPRVERQILDTARKYNDQMVVAWGRAEIARTMLRHQIYRHLFDALNRGRDKVSLGGGAGALFAQPRQVPGVDFTVLARRQYSVHLPTIPTTDWWETISDTDLLRGPMGKTRALHIDWSNATSWVATTRDTAKFEFHMKMKGNPVESLEPAMKRATKLEGQAYDTLCPGGMQINEPLRREAPAAPRTPSSQKPRPSQKPPPIPAPDTEPRPRTGPPEPEKKKRGRGLLNRLLGKKDESGETPAAAADTIPDATPAGHDSAPSPEAVPAPEEPAVARPTPALDRLAAEIGSGRREAPLRREVTQVEGIPAPPPPGADPPGAAPSEASDLPSLADELKDYAPSRFFLGQDHVGGKVRVEVDGQVCPPDQILQQDTWSEEQDTEYIIEGDNIRHGAVVRIDYESSGSI